MKTVEEMANEWFWANLTQCPSVMMLTDPPKYPPDPRDAFIAGYKAADKQTFRDNYNDHKLKEAEETITKLKERLKLLSLEFCHIMETTEKVKDLFDGWKKDKVGPWVGFFPVKKDDV